MTKTVRTLDRWVLVMAGDRGPILAGRDPFGADYRTSTPLIVFDLEAGAALTASGRPYRVIGPSDPRYALEALRALWNANGVDVRVVEVDEAVRLIARNRPFAKSAAEQAEMDAWKLPRVASQFRFLMLQRGLA
ncbi:MAG: hypothetical protein KAH44_03535, partial [Oricola sp.]|nr:hypothetical protein [Oricola sp.]